MFNMGKLMHDNDALQSALLAHFKIEDYKRIERKAERSFWRAVKSSDQ